MNRDVERRARRLVALYPREWRDRFGAEFEALLVDEMGECRRSWRRDGDVIVHALLAHLTGVGLAGGRMTSPAQARRALWLLGLLGLSFFTLGVGMWSQLSVGWAWASPTSGDARIAMALMSAALVGLAVLGLVAALLILVGVTRAAWWRTVLRLWPFAVTAACAVLLWIGCEHVGSRWPDSGSWQWSRHSLVPAALARLGWAGTLFITADWTHPAALARLPAGRLAWMTVSPALLSAAAAAAVAGLRRVPMPAEVVRALTVLTTAGAALGSLFVAGVASWILDHGLGPRRMFQPGSVDRLGLALLAVTLLLAGHLTHRLRDCSPTPAGR